MSGHKIKRPFIPIKDFVAKADEYFAEGLLLRSITEEDCQRFAKAFPAPKDHCDFKAVAFALDFTEDEVGMLESAINGRFLAAPVMGAPLVISPFSGLDDPHHVNVI